MDTELSLDKSMGLLYRESIIYTPIKLFFNQIEKQQIVPYPLLFNKRIMFSYSESLESELESSTAGVTT